jgi:hypothetical protein
LTEDVNTTNLCLNHRWSLCPKHLHSLEQVNDAFVPHPLQHNIQSREDTSSPHASTGAATKTKYDAGKHKVNQ